MNQMLKNKVPSTDMQHYIDGMNMWCKRGEKIDKFRITYEDKKRISDAIECDLSPENLCCDGEASPAHVRRMSKYLNNLKKEIEAL